MQSLGGVWFSTMLPIIQALSGGEILICFTSKLMYEDNDLYFIRNEGSVCQQTNSCNFHSIEQVQKPDCQIISWKEIPTILIFTTYDTPTIKTYVFQNPSSHFCCTAWHRTHIHIYTLKKHNLFIMLLHSLWRNLVKTV